MQPLQLRHPFPIDLESSQVQGQLIIRAVFSGPMSDEQSTGYSQLLFDTFFALAAAGGLGGIRYEPRTTEPPEFEWETWITEDGHTAVEWTVRLVFVAPQAVRVLANLFECHRFKFLDHPLLALYLQYDDWGWMPAAPDFPPEWPTCPFEVEEYDIEDEDFDIEIEFESRPVAEQGPTVGARIGAWLGTVVEGGFGGAPFDPERPGAQMNEKLLSHAGNSVILHVRGFYASLEALASLKNVLSAIHYGAAPIRHVVIGE